MEATKHGYFPQPWFVTNAVQFSDTVTKAPYLREYNKRYSDMIERKKADGTVAEYFDLFPAPCFYNHKRDVKMGLHSQTIDCWGTNPYFEDLGLLDNKPVIAFFGGNDIRNTITKDCLSQWYRSKFVVNGYEYYCMEQYMNAQKALIFGDIKSFIKIMASTSPRDASRTGRSIAGFDSTVWDTVKHDIARTGNYHKFSQNEKLREFILDTGDAVLVYANGSDRQWGIGMDVNNPEVNNCDSWKGKNLLGFDLMQVRDELNKVYKNYELINFDLITEDKD